MTAKEQKKAAADFAAKWIGRGYEKGECQKFWRGLLHDVFGIVDPDDWVQYEVPVATGFVDAYISRTKVLIEQKGFEHGLADKAAMKQAMMYVGAMPDTMPVRYIVLCNFQEFWIYDKHAPEMTPVKVALTDLPKKLGVLSFFTEVERTVPMVRDVAAVDKKAGELVGRLYRALLKSYSGGVDERVLESLNMLCVRLVFCAYAEDAGVFPKHGQFVGFMRKYSAEQLRDALVQLFRMLNTDYPHRDPDDLPELLDFPYVGSGLFDDEHIRIPRFTEETRTLLLDCLCADLDWTEINPTIFGAVFESTLSTEMRRKNGMHYTTVKNIHRVADPLFLWKLEKELDEIAAVANIKKRNEQLVAFQKRLGRLRFLDPACGSGNFLTETYISLRRLENRAIALRQQGQGEFDLGDTICVTIDQFHGIEIDGFAVSVAQTALWIAESQMMMETEKILHRRIDFLPLKRYGHIVRGNALCMDWNALLDEGKHFDYILGNPPFVGASMMTEEQKAEAVEIFGKGKRVNSIDYVGAWYYKAAQIMQGTPTCAAFVSTNSITQGEQVAPFWGRLLKEYGVEINFAWRTFIWNSEANKKAHVHCVIIGFHAGRGPHGGTEPRRLFNDDGSFEEAKHVNPYLVDAPDVVIETRGSAICDVPKMTYGNKPSDGGHLLLSEEERRALLQETPALAGCIRRYVGSRDYINNDEVRYCLWLRGVSPSVYRLNKEVLRRLEAVRQMRLSSSAAPTRAMADMPYLFFSTPQTDENYLLVPEVSSERRAYVPIGFVDKRIIAANTVSIVPNATLYHFGILTSSVHMAWMRAVAGRLEMRYRYSAAIVYNNFPWPAWSRGRRDHAEGADGNPENPVEKDSAGGKTSHAESAENAEKCSVEETLCASAPLREKIAATAQAILDARALYPDSSLADLYDPLTMPPELRKAHRANDAAVLAAYGFSTNATEGEIVAKLFKMYEELTAKEAVR